MSEHYGCSALALHVTWSAVSRSLRASALLSPHKGSRLLRVICNVACRCATPLVVAFQHCVTRLSACNPVCYPFEKAEVGLLPLGRPVGDCCRFASR